MNPVDADMHAHLYCNFMSFRDKTIFMQYVGSSICTSFPATTTPTTITTHSLAVSRHCYLKTMRWKNGILVLTSRFSPLPIGSMYGLPWSPKLNIPYMNRMGWDDGDLFVGKPCFFFRWWRFHVWILGVFFWCFCLERWWNTMMFLKVVGDHMSLFTFNLSTIGINSMGFVFVTYRKAKKD